MSSTVLSLTSSSLPTIAMETANKYLLTFVLASELKENLQAINSKHLVDGLKGQSTN